MTELVVGADVGGTWTRVAVATREGRVLAEASAGSGNPNVVGLAASTHTIATLVEQVLRGLDGTVTSMVLGMAGGSRLATENDYLRATVPERLGLLPHLVSDLAVAFCSATADPAGYVLVAGTGAVAGRVDGDEVLEQRDGWGWLLGDEGAGFWLGRAAVRSTLAALQLGQDLTALHRSVLQVSGARDHLALVQRCYAEPPIWLARFAPLVSDHARTDDSAADIAAEAVRALEQLLFSLQPAPGAPMVLAGSVIAPRLGQTGPIAEALTSSLTQRLPNPLLLASDGIVGALWMAVRGMVNHDRSVHAQLLSSAGDARKTG